MAKANRLTVRDIEALDKPGIHGDGNCLFLRVRPGGSKQWYQIVTVKGKRIERGLGGYPLVSLQEARDTAFENRRALRRGENPFETREQAAAAISNAPTFAEALEAVLAVQRQSWKNPKSEARWRASLRDYAMPTIGKMPVDAITSADVYAIVEPIWGTKRETAQRVKQRIGAVMAWAKVNQHRTDNPVDDLDSALPKARPAKTHHRALPYAEVPNAIAKVRETGAHISTKLAFEFLVLTAARSGEVRLATWGEIDRKAKTWTIPAERMKAKAEHVVPLSNAAFDVLEAVAEEFGEGDDGELIFPTVRGKAQSDNTISKLLRENGVDAVPHGFRSSFRDWAAEHGVERDIAEAALAHTVRNAVEAAYLRTDYLEKRRGVMERWAKHCEPKAATA